MIDLFQKYDLFLIDLDGVVWRGEMPIRENLPTIKKLVEKKKVYFVTNNSSLHREEYIEKLRKLGIETTLARIVTSGFISAEYTRKRKISSVFIIGEEGLKKEFLQKGIEVLSEPDEVISFSSSLPSGLVIGLDREFNYKKLWCAQKILSSGGHFIATNRDSTFPLEEGIAPGAGCIVAAVEYASSRKPDVIIGKPFPFLYLYALQREGIKKKRVIVIGDRIDTDIEGAYRAGVDSLLLLTGVTKGSDVEKYKIRPTYISESLEKLAFR